MESPANDPRSVPQLLKATLRADEDAAWKAVAALHWRGSKDVLDAAVALTRSNDAAKRGRGANILGQLGIPQRTFPKEGFAAVLPLLKDEGAGVLCDAIFALAHIDNAQAASHIIPFSDHEDDEVRHAVAFGLGAADTPEAHGALLRLMKDRDAAVRDWATFGIGELSEADTVEIKEALAVAMLDDDADVRYEGIIGLARRRDNRALGHLKRLLHENSDDTFAKAAAARFLGLSESEAIETADLLAAMQRL